MLRPRITPCLLIDNGALVKTQVFDLPKYVGDPINAVKIFNEKEADELIVLDISATKDSQNPNPCRPKCWQVLDWPEKNFPAPFEAIPGIFQWIQTILKHIRFCQYSLVDNMVKAGPFMSGRAMSFECSHTRK